MCGRQDVPSTIVGFAAAPGESYYLQVAGVSRKRTSSQVAGAGEAATFGNGGDVMLQITSRELPGCPAPEFSIADRADDVRIFLTPPEPGRRHDILSTGVSTTADNVCLRLDFAAPIDPPSAGTDNAIEGYMHLDTDMNTRSGYTPFLCGWERQLGVDVAVDLSSGSGQLLRLRRGGVAQEGQFAIALFDERSMTVVIPKAAMGGGAAFRFVVQLSKPMGGEDCAPDRGFIQVLPPALGDANCDGEVDSRDAVIILQFFARLAPSLLCEYVADANGNGTIGSIDAALILQLDAGLINVLPATASEAIAAVVQLTAANRRIPKEQIEVSRVTVETWSNACLGLPKAGEACAAVLTPGYRISVWLGLEGITYRTDLTGSIIRVEGGVIV